jgi:subtilisin family serine protease
MRRITLTLVLLTTVAVLGCESDTPTNLVDQPTPLMSLSSSLAQPMEAAFFLVGFESESQLNAAATSVGGLINRVHPEIGVAQVGGLDQAGADALASYEGIDWVERDLIVQWLPEEELNATAFEAAGPAADPTEAFFYPCQWNMSQIDAPDAWAEGEFGDPDVKVALLDTGVDPNHSDLLGRIDLVNSVSMLTEPSPCNTALGLPDQETINDYNFHGSFVSGIIASNGSGVASVAPDAQIVGVKVLDCTGGGSFDDVIAGILYAAGLADVSVINMSLSAYFPISATGGGRLVGAMAKAVNYAQAQGKLVVSAAGNTETGGINLDKDENFIVVPAQAGSGIAAWAGDVNGDLASYSNYGRSGAWVGAGGGDGIDPSPPLPGCVLDPGGQGGIISVCSSMSPFFSCGTNSYLYNAAGTSFSAPMVSGVAALVDGKYGGSLSAAQLKTILSRTADDIGRRGVDLLFSHGRVNAGNAVKH